MRPTGPDQVAISYYQASLVVEWIEAERGFQAIRDLLAAYRDGRTTPEAFTKVLGTTLPDFDRAFFAHLQSRFGGALASLDDFETSQKAARRSSSRRSSRRRCRISSARATRSPSTAGRGTRIGSSRHSTRSRALREGRGEALARLTAINESHYQANLELAMAREEKGDAAGAAAALERALYIWPFEPGPPPAAGRAPHEAAGTARGWCGRAGRW